MLAEKEDLWDATWALLSLGLGQTTASFTVYPTLNEAPMFSRVAMTIGFGMLLTATYFIMGIPCVGALRHGFNSIRKKMNVGRKTRSEES